MEIEDFEEFFRQNYDKELIAAALSGKKSIVVDFTLLDKTYPDLADKILNDPEATLNAARDAIKNMDLIKGDVKLEPRFRNLPERFNIRIRNLRSEHVGKFLSLDGTVRRATDVKPEVSVATYQCPECGKKMEVIQKERFLTPPLLCENPECGRKGGFGMPVDRKLFDARWIVIEEPFEIVTGERPGQVNVYLKEDLTTPEMQRKTDPGNRLKVSGTIKEIKKIIKGRMRTQMDIYVEANHVENTEIEWEEVIVTPEDEKRIKEYSKDPEVYNKIVASIAPSIYGLDEIKSAIMLQIFGGVQHNLPDKTRIRGDIHVLLIGDPSTGKSQLLKLISSIIPRGKYVGGRGATAAGLTATVVKDEEFGGGWMLEAGAMVLANKGILAVDEFDKMTKEDQVAMHEGLEQQQISIAKASIIATLPAQVSVLAGANPKYFRFDRYKPLVEQVDIPDTLLSRFDLKFALRDVPNKENDERIATHILETRLNPSLVEPVIAPEFLRKYIAYARKNSKPKMTREVIERLKNFYIDMRNLYSGGDTVAITLRQNEALMRLTEASAKIRLSDVVEQQDADRAINIMKFSIQQLAFDFETGKIDIDRTEGVPASQRSKIHIILDIIDMLEKKIGKPVAKVEVIAAAEEQGLKVEVIEDLLRRLKSEGSIFEPKINYIESIK